MLSLYFVADLPAAGVSTYFVVPVHRAKDAAIMSEKASVTTISNEFYELNFDPSTNLTSRLTDSKTGKAIDFHQDFLWYVSSEHSDPYVFLPNTSVADPISTTVSLEITSGPIFSEALQVLLHSAK